MNTRTRLAVFAAVSALAILMPALHAQVPQLINYQGRVAVGAVNFDGSGQFKFALVNPNGTTTYWSNNGSSSAGSQPSAAVALTVTKGLYSVLLGDASLANMTAIPGSVFSNGDVRLRVWFNDGTSGSQLLTPDQRLAPNGYLPDGSVSFTAIADGAVHSMKIAPGAVSTVHLAGGAVSAAKLGSDVGLWSANGAHVFRNSGNVGINKITPATALDVNGTVTATGFSGSGAGLASVNALTLGGLSSSNFWAATGNAGTTPGTHFLGTTDNQALEFKVNGTRGLRLEPTANPDTVNVIGGSARNSAGAGVVGVTIGGGGSSDFHGAVYTNQVDGDFGTVSGGAQNTIQFIANYATIGGGSYNTIQTNAALATIGGGLLNTILTNASFATIPGGRENSATDYAFAAGRRAKANHTGAFVWADSGDMDFASTANNQFLIRAAGNVGINKPNPATALDVNGTVTATGFSGSGAGLSSLNAASLTGSVPGAALALTPVPSSNLTGTIPDARLSGAVSLLGTGIDSAEIADGAIVNAHINTAAAIADTKLATISTAGKVANSATTATTANTANAIVARDATGNFFAGLVTATGLHWASSSLNADQGGSLELGNSAGSGTIPFIDFHFGIGSDQDHNVRLINNADGQLACEGASGGNVNFRVAGTVTATSFNGNAGAPLTLGTTGDQAMEFKVNGVRALRLDPTAEDGLYSNVVNVIGGSPENAVGAGVRGATIAGGGALNKIVVGSGLPNSDFNEVTADFGTVGGGRENSSDGPFATVGGGGNNHSTGDSSTIGGGSTNSASGNQSTVPGGYFNQALGDLSFAAGSRARANHDGAFVWADTTDADFESTGANQFLIRATGGVGINTANPAGAALAVNGAVTATSTTTEGFEVRGSAAGYSLHDRVSGAAKRWVMFAANGTLAFHSAQTGTNLMSMDELGNLSTVGTVNGVSDRNKKENFQPVDPRAVLDKVAALPLTEWNYKTDAATRHVGPMAQDFHAAFNVGMDDKHIATVDADGVALAAIQGLNQKLEERLQEKDTRIAALELRLEKLERLIERESAGGR